MGIKVPQWKNINGVSLQVTDIYSVKTLLSALQAGFHLLCTLV